MTLHLFSRLVLNTTSKTLKQLLLFLLEITHYLSHHQFKQIETAQLVQKNTV